MLVVTAVLITALGCYLKHGLLAPFDLYREDPVIAVPFLLLADKSAQAEIQEAMNPTEPAPTEAMTEDTTEKATEMPTNEPTEAFTETPVEVITEPPTEMPTEPPTEPIVIDESWFDDALFIGDSRVVSLSVIAPLGKAHYFCDQGLSIFDVRYKKCHSKDFYSTRLDKLLDENTYGKIYIMLGINALNMPHDEILTEYVNLMDLLHEKEPDAAIIIQSVMTVGKGKAASSKHYAIENIYALNEKLSEFADGEMIFYLDINELVADEEGYLRKELSKDGVHFYAERNPYWSQWLMDTAPSLGIR